jgi:homopolymeric O-antigen transport system ATP-binding protein
MSSDVVITAAGLGKQYRLGRRLPAFRTLRDTLAEQFSRRGNSSKRELMWALEDVSFDVYAGEAIGVIGANGAGKTTLLKILSRITAPTTGEVRIRGRVGSLLEVGTGFHPELTGRENIFLNGAILGMRRQEIVRKLDDIVAFAGVERFIDTPVKRYSSGMYVRLAFAVAAHLDTDILLVDEVLSVGDFGFQRRSLGRMQEQTQGEGRTVLFVSHNLGAIRTLTQRCVWLERGRLRSIGPTPDVLRDYMLSHSDREGGGVVDLSDLTDKRPPSKLLAHKLSFESIALFNEEGVATETHLSGQPVRVALRIRAHEPMRDRSLDVRCRIFTAEGVLLFSAASTPRPVELERGVYETSFLLDPNPLAAGLYSMELFMVTMGDNVVDEGQDLINRAMTLRIEESPASDLYVGDRRGLINVAYDWSPVAPAPDGVRSFTEASSTSAR